jgi:hypothetical protein
MLKIRATRLRGRERYMARTRLMLLILSLAAGLGLSTPTPVAACSGCDTSFREFVATHPSIVLASYRGRSGPYVLFDVIDVLKGPSLRVVMLEPTDRSPGPRPWGRWLLAPTGSLAVDGRIDSGVMVEGFRVSPSGIVTNSLPGSGAVNVYPRTLAGWYRALGLGMPDTSTAVANPPTALTAPGLDARQLVLVAVGIVAALAMFSRRRQARANGRAPYHMSA